jgi:polysaccharide biosynthesis/export protein
MKIDFSPANYFHLPAFVVFPFALVTLILLSGCQSSRGPQFDAHADTKAKLGRVDKFHTVSKSSSVSPEFLQPGTKAHTLGPGDRLEIEMVGQPESRQTLTVGPDGRIYYDLLPGIDVWGLTPSQAKFRIEKEMSQYVKASPQVHVTLRGVESKKVWILGRVGSPGVYSLAGPTTLLEAVTLAGGPASSTASTGDTGTGIGELADLNKAFVMRRGQIIPVDFKRLLKEGDVSQNIYVQPDDFIYFPTAVARNIYVMGAVGTPRILRYRDNMSLVSAVAGAGGSVQYAHLREVAVVRGSLANPKVAIVDFEDIIKGRHSDVLLEPSDIVYVPYTPFQSVARYADVILNTFARTIGANEGALFVDPDARPVGTSVSVGTP